MTQDLPVDAILTRKSIFTLHCHDKCSYTILGRRAGTGQIKEGRP